MVDTDGGIRQTYHIGALRDDPHARFDERLRLLHGDFVLRGPGQRDVHLREQRPRALAWRRKASMMSKTRVTKRN